MKPKFELIHIKKLPFCAYQSLRRRVSTRMMLLGMGVSVGLFLSGCAGYPGAYVSTGGGYYGPSYGYYGPYYGGYGPYDGGDFFIGGYRHGGHYGNHHFAGSSFGHQGYSHSGRGGGGGESRATGRGGRTGGRGERER